MSRGILERMTRDIERWWVLRKLQKTTDKHTAENVTQTNIARGVVATDGREGFARWLADCSMKLWILRPVKLWRYRWKLYRTKNETAREKLVNDTQTARIGLYTSLINSCIGSNLIFADGEAEAQKLHTTPFGDDFVSSYWWKRTLGHPIATAIFIAVIGGILVWFATERIDNLNEQEASRDQVYRIQLLGEPQKVLQPAQ